MTLKKINGSVGGGFVCGSCVFWLRLIYVNGLYKGKDRSDRLRRRL